MTGKQKWRKWLGFVWDYWKTALEYVPPELAMVFDILGRANDWLSGRGTVATKSCSASVPQDVWMSSKYHVNNSSLPDYRACGNAHLGQASSPAFSEAEIFQSPPPSYDDFSNDVPITTYNVSSSGLSLDGSIVASATQHPSFAMSRAQFADMRSRDVLIGLPTPSPQGLTFLDPLNTLEQLTPSPLVVDEPIFPAVNIAPTYLAVSTLDVGSLAMDSLDVSGHVYSSPSTSLDWDENSTRSLASAYDGVGTSTVTPIAVVNAPLPPRAGVGTPVRIRATGTSGSRIRRRLRNKENLPPQSPEESSPEPIARRTRASAINPARRNAVIISSPRSFRP